MKAPVYFRQSNLRLRVSGQRCGKQEAQLHNDAVHKTVSLDWESLQDSLSATPNRSVVIDKVSKLAGVSGKVERGLLLPPAKDSVRWG